MQTRRAWGGWPLAIAWPAVVATTNTTWAQEVVSIAPPPAEASSTIDAELQRKLMALAARCPMFDMLGDPLSSAGRELKAMFANENGRAAALRAILPVARDPQRDLADRRDAWRLTSAILGRAGGDDALPAIVKNDEFAAQLQEIVGPVAADAKQLVDAILAEADKHIAAEFGAPAIAAPADQRAEAHKPGVLVVQHLFLLARLGANAQVDALYRSALDGANRREKEGGTPIADGLYRGASFPQGSFLWAFGLLPDGAGATEIVQVFDHAVRRGDAKTLWAALDAMQTIEFPDPTLIDRVRAIVDDPTLRRRTEQAGAPAGPPEPVEYGEVSEVLRAASKRYIDLGVKRFRSCGDLAWLDTALGWVARPVNAREHETLTLARASNVDLALCRVVEPTLWPRLLEAIPARLGSGHPTINDRSFLWLLSLLPKPTEGVGSERHVTSAYENVLSVACRNAAARFKPQALQAIRVCGRWAAGTSLEETVRAELRSTPMASQALAHVRGAAARAELESLRENGLFQGTPSPEAAAQFQELRDMFGRDADTIKGAVRMVVEPRLLARDGRIDPADARFAKLDRAVEAVVSLDHMSRAADHRSARREILASLKQTIEEAIGDGATVIDAELEMLSFRVSNSLQMWLHVLADHDFDWNLARALEIVDLCERLDSRDPAEIRAVLADLRRRREARVFEVAGFDVYAWVPQIILLYEEADDRFAPSEATRIRRDILSTFATFRSTVGREFLAAVAADDDEREEIRQHVASLSPRRIKELGDEAH